MNSYKLKDNFSNGYVPNSKPPKENILFKKGDIVQGVVYERYIFNRLQKGIDAKPTVEGAYLECCDGKTFVPLDILEQINSFANQPINNIKNDSQINDELFIKLKLKDVITPPIFISEPTSKTPQKSNYVPREKNPFGLIVALAVFLGILYYASDKKSL